jgi:Tol biopolymer transport system component
MRRLSWSLLVWSVACVSTPLTPVNTAANPEPRLLPQETHLSNLRQLTFGGENAEAYWRFDGTGLSLQARGPNEGCDRIQTLALTAAGPQRRQLSSGNGATTCAHWFPNGREVLYASTHLGGPKCPPKPDMSLGYVWALTESLDIFKAQVPADGKPVDDRTLVRLTSTPGYDAEGTVCAKDGSILFTSVRDGDLELYRMNADGSNVKRLTSTPGYDGGGFFNRDCTKIVWRASRPAPGPALEDYNRLLSQGLVRPSKLELYVANADGSDARQVTYLNAASFAPFFFPHRDRIIFSSNAGDPKGREFDLWAVNTDGTDLERITSTAGFDGFPMFSPDGKALAFSSNRMTAEGKSDTNLFLADWRDDEAKAEATAAERIRDDVAWLADPAREGRGIGTPGLAAAGAWVEARFQALGLEPAGSEGFRQPFTIPVSVRRGPKSALSVSGTEVGAGEFTPLGFTSVASVSGSMVLAGYGLQEEGVDDYAGLNVKGKVVVVRRFVPDVASLATPASQRRAGDLRRKAFLAKAAGATAVVVVDWPVSVGGAPLPRESPLPTLRKEGSQDAGLPVIVVTRAALAAVWAKLEKKQAVPVKLVTDVVVESATAFNVIGRLPGAAPALVIGAHYDHLGAGGPNSLSPDSSAPHLGADDNASGVAALLEVARSLKAKAPAREVIVVAFSGEEEGVLGSAALVASKPQWLSGAWAMLNLDMVGRLRLNELQVLGAETAPEWKPLIESVCSAARVKCQASGDGYGPSDHISFSMAGLPVLHFFTGAHGDYHKPSDSADKVNAIGAAKVAEVVTAVAQSAGTKLTFMPSVAPVRGDARSFNASLGTVPNYGGGVPGVPGVLLDDVRPGGGAAQAGLRRGDVIQKIGRFDVSSVEDLMFVLTQSRPGETVKAVISREGQRVELQVTFQEGRRH